MMWNGGWNRTRCSKGKVGAVGSKTEAPVVVVVIVAVAVVTV